MLKVWGRANSLNVQKVMWTVGELGLAHERIDAGGPFGGLDGDYAAMNPNRLVPTVKTADGLVLFESSAIVRHLARTDPERRLWPEDPALEATADVWAEWATTTPQRAVTDVFWSIIRVAPSKRDAATIDAAVTRLSHVLTIAEHRLADREFLVASNLTIADIAFGSLLYRAFTMEIALPELPAVRAYYERLAARPAYAAHVMVSYDGLRVADA